MKVLIVDNGTKHLVALQRRFQNHEVRTIKYPALHPDQEAWAELIVLSGGGKVSIVGHRLFYRKQIALLRSFNKPIIGICLGHQLIGTAYGARPRRLFRKVQGLRKIIASMPESIPDNTELRVWEGHRWALKRAPVNFEILGTSTSGVEVMRHMQKPIYSVQFHPEVISPTNDGMQILDAILSVIK